MSITSKDINLLAKNQLKSGILSMRKTYISLPKDAVETDPAMYFNGQLIAVEGFDTKSDRAPKRHFCVLLNRPENLNSPSIREHEVVEFYFKDLDEQKIPEDRKLEAWTPMDGNIQGYAFIVDSTPKLANIPPVAGTSGFDLKAKPEMNASDTKVIGNSKGGIAVNIDGNTHIITGEGKEVVIGVTIDLGTTELKGTGGVGDNDWVISNSINDGRMFAFSMPDLLPLFIAVGKIPNVPKIINLYLEIDRYKTIIQGIGDITETLMA